MTENLRKCDVLDGYDLLGGWDGHWHNSGYGCGLFNEFFEFKPGDIRADWTNLSDVEVIVYHFWTDSHLPIQTVDTVSNLVTFAHKAGKTFTDDFSEDGARYVVDNVFEGLDAPGERDLLCLRIDLHRTRTRRHDHHQGCERSEGPRNSPHR
jgi:hypothetical protein